MGKRKPTDSASEDPAALSMVEKDLIRADWSLVRQDLKGVGFQLFQLFFKQNPSYVNKFPFLQNKSIEEICQWRYEDAPPRYHVHAHSVMKKITAMVDMLDQPHILTPALQKVGRDHKKFTVSGHHFNNIKVAIMELLATALKGAGYDDEHKQAWNKALTSFVMVIFAELDPVEASAIAAGDDRVSKRKTAT